MVVVAIVVVLVMVIVVAMMVVLATATAKAKAKAITRGRKATPLLLLCAPLGDREGISERRHVPCEVVHHPRVGGRQKQGREA